MRNLLINGLALAATVTISTIILYRIVFLGGAGEFGLVGVFLAALFSHLTVVGRELFIPVFLPFTAIYHPILLGVLAGLGGALGETATYYLGVSISEIVEGGSRDDRISRWIDKYGLLAILIVAASPLPDTPIILLAGSARFPLLKFLLIEIFGKTVWYSVGAFFGGILFTQISNLFGYILSSLMILIVSIILCIILLSKRVRKNL